MRFFISYSKTREAVFHLKDELEIIFDHADVWFDQEMKNRGGQAWWDMICEAIRRCDVFLYALSPHTLNSPACDSEYSYARALKRPVLPVVLEPFDDSRLPTTLRESQWVHFTARSSEQRRSLKGSIQNLASVVLPDPLPPQPAVPLDLIGVLRERIQRLSSDANEQRYLIADIDDLRFDEAHAPLRLELLQALARHGERLTKPSRTRLQELLATLTQSPAPAPHIEVAQPPPEPKPQSPAPAPRIEAAQPPAAPRTPQLGDRRTDPKTGALMVYVPPGKFRMGANDIADDEKPVHEQVIAQGFWLDLTPVTNAAYAKFVRDGGYQQRDLWTAAGWAWCEQNGVSAPENYDGFTAPDQPRVGISWYEAWAFAAWRGCRLPTEAEWEWAARGAENWVYPWGDNFMDSLEYVIYSGNSGGTTHTVGEGIRLKGAAWCGALDMSGNVWEWLSSLYQPYPYNAADGREAAGGTGARVLRGRSWGNSAYDLRCACRSRNSPVTRSNRRGLRLALS